MKHLPVEIIADEVVIGTADLRPSDPSMGVAYATFRPSPAYMVDRHARASEERVLELNPIRLSARNSAGEQLKCAGVDLEDFSATLGDDGREVWVFGLEGFQAYFD